MIPAWILFPIGVLWLISTIWTRHRYLEIGRQEGFQETTTDVAVPRIQSFLDHVKEKHHGW